MDKETVFTGQGVRYLEERPVRSNDI